MNRSLHKADRTDLDAIEARLGARLGAALTGTLSELPADVESRLRFAREQALQRRAAPAVVVHAGGGSAVLGGLAAWWLRLGPRLGLGLGMALPAAVLALGVLWVQEHRQQQAVAVAAQVDSVLLVDDLPPQAYADPGFVAFLKLRQP